jgi:two-component system chemotaxis response regulator CheY
MRALIVDDSNAMHMILKRVLKTCGFEDFVDAENGAQALDVLRSGPLPDIAFVDWNMPEMNGIELVRAVRAETRFDEMALVMVTSETAIEHVQAAIEAGADEYVMKPFTTDVVAGKLALVRASRD